MLKVINPTRLLSDSFCWSLVSYLDTHKEIALRDIREVFTDGAPLDHSLERLIKAGYIERKDRRYSAVFTRLTSLESLELDQEVFVETDSPIYHQLQQLTYPVETANVTNGVIICEDVDFMRENLTLDTYFYRRQNMLEVAEFEQELYWILGDVNKEYALKYMTTFLLKFIRKEVVMQKRSDIFVTAMCLLGFIEKIDESSYRLAMTVDRVSLRFISHKR